MHLYCGCCAAFVKRVFISNNDMEMKIEDVLDHKSISIFFVLGLPHKIKT
jgi:hypothetical protein